jgi:hypothetical protein
VVRLLLDAKAEAGTADQARALPWQFGLQYTRIYY